LAETGSITVLICPPLSDGRICGVVCRMYSLLAS
jgi:hypothetical protein